MRRGRPVPLRTGRAFLYDSTNDADALCVPLGSFVTGRLRDEVGSFRERDLARLAALATVPGAVS